MWRPQSFAVLCYDMSCCDALLVLIAGPRSLGSNRSVCTLSDSITSSMFCYRSFADVMLTHCLRSADCGCNYHDRLGLKCSAALFAAAAPLCQQDDIMTAMRPQ